MFDERPPSLQVDDKTKTKLWKPIGEVITIKQENDSDEEKPKISLQFKTESGRGSRNVDSSPPRRNNRDNSRRGSSSRVIDDDYSPPRRRNNDSSPPRRENNDISPPRRKNHSSHRDTSPPRHRNDDISPPRKRQVGNSPPRRSHKDNSPHRRDFDNSPPRKKSTNSPLRRKNCSNSSPRSKQIDSFRRKYNNSPPHERGASRSPTFRNKSPPRRGNSPPRKKSRFSSPSKTDSSPPRRKSRFSSPPKTDSSPPRKRRPDENHHKSSRTEKTLDGKKAGLQNASDLAVETQVLREKENEMFAKMSAEVSGKNATTVIRKRNPNEDPVEVAFRIQKEKETKEKYDRWGKGLKQVEDQTKKQDEELYEMSKPLARYADDEDLEKYLKEQEREGDPMLAYIRKKKRKQQIDEGVKVKPQYEGEFLPNRFGIRPGCRWDGVDRSNGYEKKWFDVQNAKKAQQDETYKWSTEDM